MKNKDNIINGMKIGYVLTGSFCTFDKSFAAAQKLIALGSEIIPIMSENAANIDTRFGTAKDNIRQLENIAGRKVISSIVEAETVGPSKMCDLIVVAPCTGNTIAKLANSITDTAVVNKRNRRAARGSSAAVQ